MTNPANIITVYSAQKKPVTAALLGGQRHVQPWAKSAAYDLPNRPNRHAHRRAYMWMASQFERRTGQSLQTAPVWLSFDLKTVLHFHNLYTDRNVTENVLELRIPASELLISMYQPCCEQILEGQCTTHRAPRPNLRLTPCKHRGKVRRQTWEAIFNLSQNPHDWQAIAKHIEPHWLVGVHA